MAIIFDGKTYSAKKKELLRSGVTLLKEKGIIPHIATIIIGNDPASVLYVNLKKKFIEDIGCQLDIYRLNESTSFEDIKLLINSLNDDKTVHGIMVQMPLPETLKSERLKIINLITDNKDVDGLRENSKFLHPTSKAAIEILLIAANELKSEVKSVCVVGSDGMVGKPLAKELTKLGYTVFEANEKTDSVKLQSLTLQSDAIISATGVINLIGPEMVKDNQVLIDVGAPFGDISPQVEDKAGFLTPVPGGVGPVTITCLAENLILSVN